MNEFLQMVLSELQSSLAAAIALVLMAGGVMVWSYRRHQKKYGGETPFPWKRAMLILLLVGYLAIVEYATIGRLGSLGGSGTNFHLFRAWKEAWNNYSVKNWANVLLNVALFMPLGVLVPLVFPKCGKWSRMLAVGFLGSLTIEALQWLNGCGIFDVDDLFANTLGAMMGWCFLMTILSVAKKRWSMGVAYGLLTLIPVAAVGGIFLAYEIQPYGNLPDSCVYRVDTGDVTWALECELPDMPETAAVYRANAMTVAECDEFARDFAKYWGGEYDDIFYYDKETYFRDYDTDGWMHYLTVSHLDGGFDYWGEYGNFDYGSGVWAELDRTQAEQFLLRYGVAVPAEAEFFMDVNEYRSADQHWHCFRADRIPTESGLADGTVSFQVSADGSCIDIDNHLITYAYFADESILSPEKAYEKLCGGYFYAGWFEYQDPAQVSVLSCTLGYETDTKGFYQPVYLFEVMVPGWTGSDTIMIPAIA